MRKKDRRSTSGNRRRRHHQPSELQKLLLDLNLIGRARKGIVPRPRLAALAGRALLLTLDPDLPGDQLDNQIARSWIDPEPFRVRLKAYSVAWLGQGTQSIRRALGEVPPARHPIICAVGGIALCYLAQTIQSGYAWGVIEWLNRLATAPIALPDRVRDLCCRFSQTLKSLLLEHEKRIGPLEPFPIEARLSEPEVYEILAAAFENACQTIPEASEPEPPGLPVRRGRLRKTQSQVEVIVEALKSAPGPLSAKQIGAEAARRGREMKNVTAVLSRAIERYPGRILRTQDTDGDRTFVWARESLPRNPTESPNTSAPDSVAIRGN